MKTFETFLALVAATVISSFVLQFLFDSLLSSRDKRKRYAFVLMIVATIITLACFYAVNVFFFLGGRL